ncbi:MAG: hypothetical protein ABI963_14280 [Rhizomicrobium sp.]
MISFVRLPAIPRAASGALLAAMILLGRVASQGRQKNGQDKDSAKNRDQ